MCTWPACGKSLATIPSSRNSSLPSLGSDTSSSPEFTSKIQNLYMEFTASLRRRGGRGVYVPSRTTSGPETQYGDVRENLLRGSERTQPPSFERPSEVARADR